MSHTYSDTDRQQLAGAHVQAQNARYSAELGRGAVTVTVNGLQELVAVKIAPAALRGDAKILEDLLVKAANDALRQSTRALSEQMRGLQGALGIDLDSLRVQGDGPEKP